MRKPVGTVEYKGKPGVDGRWVGRCTLQDGSRPWVDPLGTWPRSPEGRARAREAIAALSERLRAAGAVSAPKPESEEQATDPKTMAGWFETWIAYRAGKGLTSTRENRQHYEHHVKPVIGSHHVKDWTIDDLRRLSVNLDERVQRNELGWKTAKNIWGTAGKMLTDSWKSNVDAIRCRTDRLSTRDVEAPGKGAEVEKQFLYPSEFLKFVTCGDIPLSWRRVVALSVYLGTRLGELAVLCWEHVDLEHASIHIHQARHRVTKREKQTKGKAARRFDIEPELLPLLEAMKKEPGLVIELPAEDMARGFQKWLKKAGVSRHELFHATETSKKITAHDLRGTAATWWAARGDNPYEIQQRLGHQNHSTTEIYVNLGKKLGRGFGEPFPPLPRALYAAPVPGSPGSSSPAGGSIPGPGSASEQLPQPPTIAGLPSQGGPVSPRASDADCASFPLDHGMTVAFESRPLRNDSDNLRAARTDRWTDGLVAASPKSDSGRSGKALRSRAQRSRRAAHRSALVLKFACPRRC